MASIDVSGSQTDLHVLKSILSDDQATISLTTLSSICSLPSTVQPDYENDEPTKAPPPDSPLTSDDGDNDSVRIDVGLTKEALSRLPANDTLNYSSNSESFEDSGVRNSPKSLSSSPHTTCSGETSPYILSDNDTRDSGFTLGLSSLDSPKSVDKKRTKKTIENAKSKSSSQSKIMIPQKHSKQRIVLCDEVDRRRNTPSPFPEKQIELIVDDPLPRQRKRRYKKKNRKSQQQPVTLSERLQKSYEELAFLLQKDLSFDRMSEYKKGVTKTQHLLAENATPRKVKTQVQYAFSRRRREIEEPSAVMIDASNDDEYRRVRRHSEESKKAVTFSAMMPDSYTFSDNQSKRPKGILKSRHFVEERANNSDLKPKPPRRKMQPHPPPARAAVVDAPEHPDPTKRRLRKQDMPLKSHANESLNPAVLEWFNRKEQERKKQKTLKKQERRKKISDRLAEIEKRFERQEKAQDAYRSWLKEKKKQPVIIDASLDEYRGVTPDDASPISTTPSASGRKKKGKKAKGKANVQWGGTKKHWSGTDAPRSAHRLQRPRGAFKHGLSFDQWVKMKKQKLKKEASPTKPVKNAFEMEADFLQQMSQMKMRRGGAPPKAPSPSPYAKAKPTQPHPPSPRAKKPQPPSGQRRQANNIRKFVEPTKPQPSIKSRPTMEPRRLKTARGKRPEPAGSETPDEVEIKELPTKSEDLKKTEKTPNTESSSGVSSDASDGDKSPKDLKVKKKVSFALDDKSELEQTESIFITTM